MTALRRPDKLRRFRDGMCAVVGMVRNGYGKEEKEHGTAVGTVDCGRCSGLLEKGYE